MDMTDEEYAKCLEIARERIEFCERYNMHSDRVYRVGKALLKAHGERRAPGTVEICTYEAEHYSHGRCPDDRSKCKNPECPLRSTT